MIDFPDAPAENDVFQKWVYRQSVWRTLSYLKDEAVVAPYGKAKRNGAWVEAATKLIMEMAGVASGTKDQALPTGTRQVRYAASFGWPTGAASMDISIRVSLDGTVYSAAQGYQYWGLYNTSATAGVNVAATNGFNFTTVPGHSYPDNWFVPAEGFHICGPDNVAMQGMEVSWPINTSSQYCRSDLRFNLISPVYTGVAIKGLRFRNSGAYVLRECSFAAVEVMG